MTDPTTGTDEMTGDETDEDEPGPLASIMADNADLISMVIAQYGPSYVAEFFVNAGTAIAAMYGLNAAFEAEIPVYVPEGA